MKLINHAVEKGLLCACLENPKVRAYAFAKLKEQYFADELNREVWDLLVYLSANSKPIPSVRLLCQNPGLSADAQDALKTELDLKRLKRYRGYRKADVDDAIETLGHFQQKRQLYEMEKWVADKLSLPSRVPIKKIKSHIQNTLTTMEDPDFDGGRLTFGKGGNVSNTYIKDNLKNARGAIIPTGFPSIDNRIGGWSRGNLVLFTAQRAQGKSLLAKSMSLRQFHNGHSVYLANLEMTGWEYLTRLFAEETKFSHERLRVGFKGKGIREVIKAKKRLDAKGRELNASWTVRTVKSSGYTPMVLHNELRHQGYAAVYIDYVNLFHTTERELWKAIYDYSKYLKMMAKNLNMLVIVLAQMTKDDEAKYARALEEDTDVWLKWHLQRDTPWVTVEHGKARHYYPFSFKLLFDAHNLRFVDPLTISKERQRKIELRATKEFEKEQQRKERRASKQEVTGKKPHKSNKEL